MINWFEQTFLSRLNDKANGRIVIVMQRLHEDDLCGHLLNAVSPWEHLKIPIKASNNIFFQMEKVDYLMKESETLHQTRDSEDFIIKLQKEIGLENFHAQYLQVPLPSKSNILSLQDLCFYEEIPTNFDIIFQLRLKLPRMLITALVAVLVILIIIII